jgi:hypothetical protein
MLVIVTDFAILILPFRVCAFKGFEIIWLSNILAWSVPDEVYY